jgi:large conductance mechanosensitive channel
VLIHNRPCYFYFRVPDKSFLEELKSFEVKGHVIDLAVGVIIGGAFGKIVDSVVGDLVMPLVSRAFGGLDFSKHYWALAGQKAKALPGQWVPQTI